MTLEKMKQKEAQKATVVNVDAANKEFEDKNSQAITTKYQATPAAISISNFSNPSMKQPLKPKLRMAESYDSSISAVKLSPRKIASVKSL